MVSYNTIRRLVKEWVLPALSFMYGEEALILEKKGRNVFLAAKKKESTTAVAARLAQPVLEELGLTLWDLRFEKEGSLWYLRYFVDKEEGITIQDCEAFSRAVDKLHFGSAGPSIKGWMPQTPSTRATPWRFPPRASSGS